MTDRETTSVDEKPSVLDLTAPHTRRDFLKKAGLGTAGLAAAWMVPQITSVHPAQAYNALTRTVEDFCEPDGKKPQCISLIYTANYENPPAPGHSQDPSHVKVIGPNPTQEKVFIVITDQKPGAGATLGNTRPISPPYVWKEDEYSLGEVITFCGEVGGNGLVRPETTVFVYATKDAYEGDDDPLQIVSFHTSCSQPLVSGDQFGSIRLYSVDNDY